MTETKLLEQIGNYFESEIFNKYKVNTLKNNSSLSSYNINPILVKYLSKILEDDFTPEGITKALFYPRVLGTSINTSFGTKVQNMFVKLNLAKPSLIKGMDIEFEDKVDGRNKWCQLKSGPNTINSEDVNPLLRKFDIVTNLARTNGMKMNNSDCVLGIIYGDTSELSQHYKIIDQRYPVYIADDFWCRLTGFENFYNQLVPYLDSVILDNDTENFFMVGYDNLLNEVRNSDYFDFS